MPTNDIIKNCATIDFDLCGKKRTIFSNEVEAKKIKIEVIKEQDCQFVFEGDKICYTVKICSDCDIKLYNVEFIDSISENTQYVHDSFQVNGIKKTPMMYGNTLRYGIDELKEKEELEIKFEVTVD